MVCGVSSVLAVRLARILVAAIAVPTLLAVWRGPWNNGLFHVEQRLFHGWRMAPLPPPPVRRLLIRQCPGRALGWGCIERDGVGRLG